MKYEQYFNSTLIKFDKILFHEIELIDLKIMVKILFVMKYFTAKFELYNVWGDSIWSITELF